MVHAAANRASGQTVRGVDDTNAVLAIDAGRAGRPDGARARPETLKVGAGHLSPYPDRFDPER